MKHSKRLGRGRVGLARPLGGLGGVGRPTRWSEGPTLRSWWIWEAHPKVREGSGGPQECSGGVRRPIQRFGRHQEAHLEVMEGS